MERERERELSPLEVAARAQLQSWPSEKCDSQKLGARAVENGRQSINQSAAICKPVPKAPIERCFEFACRFNLPLGAIVSNLSQLAAANSPARTTTTCTLAPTLSLPKPTNQKPNQTQTQIHNYTQTYTYTYLPNRIKAKRPLSSKRSGLRPIQCQRKSIGGSVKWAARPIQLSALSRPEEAERSGQRSGVCGLELS